MLAALVKLARDCTSLRSELQEQSKRDTSIICGPCNLTCGHDHLMPVLVDP